MTRLKDTANTSFFTEWSPFNYTSAPPPLKEVSVLPNFEDGLGGRTLRIVTLTVSQKNRKQKNKEAKGY